MATIKAVLRAKINKDGTRPLAIRITKNRKPVFIHLGYSIKIEDWDKAAQEVKKSHPNSTRLNSLILKKRSEAIDEALDKEKENPAVSVAEIKQAIKPSAESTFFGQAKLYLESLKAAGNYNVYTADKPRVNHFKEFLNDADINFSDVSVGLLERYRIFLKNYHLTQKLFYPSGKPKTIKPKGERTIENHLVVIRSVFAYAKNEGIIDGETTPFGKGKISIQFPETTKRGITLEDVKKLEDVKNLAPNHDHARNLWLLSYYFAGMRISDVLRLRWSDFQDMRLYYTMGKNKKAGSLKAPEKALLIIEKYANERRSPDDLIFSDLKKLPDLNNEFVVKRTIAFATSRYDKFLRLYVAPAAGVQNVVTMHISRHAFATEAGDKIPIQMLQKLYRHSDIKTTIGYQANFIHKDADEALESVIGK